MTIRTQQQTYAPSLGTGVTSGFVSFARDPTTYDLGPPYPLLQGWFNSLSKDIWYLQSFSSSNGSVTATWIKSSAGGQPVETVTGNTGGAVSPDSAGNVNIVGDGTTITIAGNPGTNTLTASLVGGTTAVDSFALQAGTTPCVPTSLGLITFNGGTVAAGSIPVQTNGTSANTMALQVQLSQAISSADATKVGLGAFNSLDFSVDATGFVNWKPTVAIQTFSASGTYTPTSGMKYCIIEVVGGGGGAGAANAAGADQISAGGGGGSGQYKRGVFSAATIGASQTVTIGAGGAGATTDGNNGANGGNTSVGSLIAGNGGGGGFFGTPGQVSIADGGDAGSGGAGGDLSVVGTQGGLGVGYLMNVLGGTVTVTGSSVGGYGSASFFGGGVNGNSVNASGTMVNGQSANSYGAGGGGGASWNSTTGQGGSGFDGVVVVTELI